MNLENTYVYLLWEAGFRKDILHGVYTDLDLANAAGLKGLKGRKWKVEPRLVNLQPG